MKWMHIIDDDDDDEDVDTEIDTDTLTLTLNLYLYLDSTGWSGGLKCGVWMWRSRFLAPCNRYGKILNITYLLAFWVT